MKNYNPKVSESKNQVIQRQIRPNIPIIMTADNRRQNCIQIQPDSFVVAGQCLKKQKISLNAAQTYKVISIIYVRGRALQQLVINDCLKNAIACVIKAKNIVYLKFTKAQRFELSKNEIQQTRWMFIQDIHNQTVMFEGNLNTLQVYLDKLVPINWEDSINAANQTQYIQANEDEDEEPNEVNTQICFPLPTELILKQCSNIKQSIVELKGSQKQQIMFDILKIKKEDKNCNQQLRCPIHSCQKSYKNTIQMRSHLQRHAELTKYQMTINQSQQFQFNQKALNFVLLLSHLYPSQVKKIIRKMKTCSTSH